MRTRLRRNRRRPSSWQNRKPPITRPQRHRSAASGPSTSRSCRASTIRTRKSVPFARQLIGFRLRRRVRSHPFTANSHAYPGTRTINTDVRCLVRPGRDSSHPLRARAAEGEGDPDGQRAICRPFSRHVAGSSSSRQPRDGNRRGRRRGIERCPSSRERAIGRDQRNG